MRDYRFGNFLQQLRERRGFSQYQLGALVGVSTQAVSKWETGTAKPQTGILYQLGEVLGVTVDELLACSFRTEKEPEAGASVRKKALWKQLHQALRDRYGEHMPVGVLNRYLSECEELRHTDLILFLDLLGRISAQAKARGEQICVRGALGASLAAFVAGATEVDPLLPHYVCPDCRNIEFSEEAACGWDLPPKTCSCGGVFRRDGHALPLESVRYGFGTGKEPRLYLDVSQEFFPIVRETILSCFSEYTVVILVGKAFSRPEKYVLLREKTSEFSHGQILPWEKVFDRFRSFPGITLIANPELDAYRRLAEQTGLPFDSVPFASSEVLEAFRRKETQGIPEFRTDFFRELLDAAPPASFRDLLQLYGLAHGAGVWKDNGEKRVREGVPTGKVVAFREDVFRYIQDRMTARRLSDSGYAYKILSDVCRGVYARGGMSDLLRQTLAEIGAETWFIESIGKIEYLFPKAHAVQNGKTAATLMWYKLHHPEAFNSIILGE